MKKTKSFKIMMLIAVNFALLILISDFCEITSFAINLGENGERIAALQKSLKEKGFYSGEINGLYDFSTKRAVKYFKSQNKISHESDYELVSSLDLYSEGYECCHADVELLAKHLKYTGVIGYQFMVEECEKIIAKSENDLLYRNILDLTDNINRFFSEKPTSEHYKAAYDVLKRNAIIMPHTG